MVLEPRIEARGRIGHQRKQRELVQDAGVERGRLDEENEGIVRQRVERLQRLELGQHVNGEGLRLLLLEDCLEPFRQQRVRLDEVHAPDDAVLVVFLRVFGREVQRDKRRVGPVDEPRRQPVMLPEREPVPHRIDTRRRLRVRVLQKVAQQRQLERVDARLACRAAAGCSTVCAQSMRGRGTRTANGNAAARGSTTRRTASRSVRSTSSVDPYPPCRPSRPSRLHALRFPV